MAKVRMPNPREAVILHLLVPGERYGREIRDEYENLTGDKLALGSLYTTLERMRDKKLLNAREGKPVAGRRGKRPRYYGIAANGTRALNAYQLRAASVWGRLARSVTTGGYRG